MEAFILYLIKSGSLLLLFLLVYHLFLKRETFFNSNRLYLIIGILASFSMPFITFTKTIFIERTAVESLEFSAAETVAASNIEAAPWFNWQQVLLIIYLVGVLYFGLRLIFQLRLIQRLKKESEVSQEGGIYHVRTKDHIAPFSFFKHIFYYPKQFLGDELRTILKHEKVHAQELHSADILLTEIALILQWCNPVVWLYKAVVKQNLEFLADRKTCGNGNNRKDYQYLMLKQVLGKQQIAIANPFFNSLIKKRIVMLNQNQSKPVNVLKLFLVLPFLVLFLVSFNTEEVVKFTDDPSFNTTLFEATPKFLSPLDQKDIKEISSGFGPAKDPFSQKMKFHNGIDLVASPGKKVMSSAEGIVRTSSVDTEKGNYIVIDHEDGYSTGYMHLQDRSVDEGDNVTSGMTIGYVGNTGKSTGPHLHFEILESGKAVNPLGLIPFKTEEKKPKSDKSKELVITKDTSDEELQKIKNDLAKDGIDFSYTIVHNDEKEIIDISIQISGQSSDGENFQGSYNTNSDEPIKPITILYDDESNSISFGSAKHIHRKISIHNDDGHTMVWNGFNHIGEDEDVIIMKNDGKKITINGRELDELESHGHDIKIKKHKGRHGKNVLLIKDSDDESDIEVIDEHGGFFFIDTDGEGDSVFFIDGKKATKKEVKALSPDEIESIDVSKGDKTTKKYGKKAKNGVVKIVTKKE